MNHLMITDPSYSQVDECSTGKEGNELMHQIALVTDSLDPPHTGVPWITFDHVSI